ncbi:MAG: hypothetical protein IJ066_06115, partial [Bacteroidaceae bacterium]|nr:hypothetical protein [Bacteroidaceae bacterium]
MNPRRLFLPLLLCLATVALQAKEGNANPRQPSGQGTAAQQPAATEDAAAPYGGHYSEWLTRSEMQRTPRSFLLDFSTRPKWSYVMGIELEAMLDTYLRYGGE